MSERELHVVNVTMKTDDGKSGKVVSVAAFTEKGHAESFARAYNPDLGKTFVLTVHARDVPSYLEARGKLLEPSEEEAHGG